MLRDSACALSVSSIVGGRRVHQTVGQPILVDEHGTYLPVCELVEWLRMLAPPAQSGLIQIKAMTATRWLRQASVYGRIGRPND